jgi:hypothetical protein
MFPTVDRVYVNERARNELGWQPQYSFRSILNRLNAMPSIQRFDTHQWLKRLSRAQV